MAHLSRPLLHHHRYAPLHLLGPPSRRIPDSKPFPSSQQAHRGSLLQLTPRIDALSRPGSCPRFSASGTKRFRSYRGLALVPPVSASLNSSLLRRSSKLPRIPRRLPISSPLPSSCRAGMGGGQAAAAAAAGGVPPPTCASPSLAASTLSASPHRPLDQLVFALNGERIALSLATGTGNDTGAGGGSSRIATAEGNSACLVERCPTVDASTTLNEFLRSYTRFKSTKLSCGEGGCGACAVMVLRYDPATSIVHERSVNSCLTLLFSLHGAAVVTSEGLRPPAPAPTSPATNAAGAPSPQQQQDPHGGLYRDRGFHAVHQRLAGFHASQCGYCTPGFSIALYAALRRHREGESPSNGRGGGGGGGGGGEGQEPRREDQEFLAGLTAAEAEAAMAGNLCRCTGYRPILDACRSFAGVAGDGCTSSSSGGGGGSTATGATCHLVDLEDLGGSVAANKSAKGVRAQGLNVFAGTGRGGVASTTPDPAAAGKGVEGKAVSLPPYDRSNDPQFPQFLKEELDAAWQAATAAGASAAPAAAIPANGSPALGSLADVSGNVPEWWEPQSLPQLLDVVAAALATRGQQQNQHKDANCTVPANGTAAAGTAAGAAAVELVGGATARGYYKEEPVARVCVSVSRVAELRECNISTTRSSGADGSSGNGSSSMAEPQTESLVLGAALTLAEVVEVLEKYASSGTVDGPGNTSTRGSTKCSISISSSSIPGAEVCRGIAAHVRKVAGPHVRNAATIGGNLVMAQQRAFPSDVATLLLGAGASVRVSYLTNTSAITSSSSSSSSYSSPSAAAATAADGCAVPETHVASELVPVERFLSDRSLSIVNCARPTVVTAVVIPLRLPQRGVRASADGENAGSGRGGGDGGSRARVVFESYRAAPRAGGNALAAVNAAFLVVLDDEENKEEGAALSSEDAVHADGRINGSGRVRFRGLRLAFGAFGTSHAVRAARAEAILLERGREEGLTPALLLEAARAVRETDVVPEEGTRGAEYRVDVAAGFLYHFFSRWLPRALHPPLPLPSSSSPDASHAATAATAASFIEPVPITAAAAATDSAAFVAAASTAHESGAAEEGAWAGYAAGSAQHSVVPVSRGEQMYAASDEHWPVSEPAEKLAAQLQASGEAVYVDDIAPPQGCLHATLVLSSRARARVEERDYSAALALPGVVACVDAAALVRSGIKNVMRQLFAPPETLLAEDEVHCVGEPVAIVVARTAKLAQQAARLVCIRYGPPLPPPTPAPGPAPSGAAEAADASSNGDGGAAAKEGSAGAPILTLEQAEAAGSVFEQPPMMAYFMPRSSGFEEAFAASECKIEDAEVQSGSQLHFYMETQVAMAVPDESGQLTLYTASQCPDRCQAAAAMALGLPSNAIRCITRRLGGAFGGKASRSLVVALATSMAAWHLRAPVRMCLDRATDSALIAGRHNMRARYSVGFDRTGRVKALKVDALFNSGCTVDLSLLMPFNFPSALLQYDWGAVKIGIKLAKTNLQTRTAVRGPGEVQGSFVAETVIEHVAAALGMDPTAVRERNQLSAAALRSYWPTMASLHPPPLQQPAASAAPDAAAAAAAAGRSGGDGNVEVGATEALDGEDEALGVTSRAVWWRLKQQADVEARQQRVATFNAAHRWRKRGLAMTSSCYKVLCGSKPARITVLEDGSVVVDVGGVEMGQGLWTKARQAAAYGLNQLWHGQQQQQQQEHGGGASGGRAGFLRAGEGVTMSALRVTDQDSLLLSQMGVTAGSSTSESVCQAVLLAASDLVARLRPVKKALEVAAAAAAPATAPADADVGGGGDGEGNSGGSVASEGQTPVVTWQQIVGEAWKGGVCMSAQALYDADMRADGTRAQGSMSYFSFGAAATEVEVDVLTGHTTILRSDIMFDCGKSLNPAVDIGQVEGAFVQGLGFFTTEEVVEDESTGRLLTPSTWAYKPPSADTVPRDLRVTLLPNASFNKGILSSKASGEPPLLLSTSVHCAIRAAVSDIRRTFHSDSCVPDLMADKISNGRVLAGTCQPAKADGGASQLQSQREFVRLDSPLTMEAVKHGCGLGLVERYLDALASQSG